MPDIILCTLNAKYAHSAFGLRYLYANLPPALQAKAQICEFTINQEPLDVVEQLLALAPRIICLGVYIWNATPALAVVRLLKALRPAICIILGGPEVSHEWAEQPMVALADHLIVGEGERSLPPLLASLLAGGPPPDKIIHGLLPQVHGQGAESLQLPYHLYSDNDLAQRVLYVEASRGCPFSCEFCLSSLDRSVRAFDLVPFLAAMDSLLQRGARQFKFIDRTFNLQPKVGQAILQFFLDRLRPGLFLHFEMVPDRLPEALRTIIKQFPAGALQFEIGVQTLNPAVESRISRRQNHQRMHENFAFLTQQTGVHIHADLIVGLPGEDMVSFGEGFDKLYALGPQEIQVGILKRLRGTPIVRHVQAFGLLFSSVPPYEVLQTADIDFATVQRLKRFARFWDKIVNSGRFRHTAPLLWHGRPSVFAAFLSLSDWLTGTLQQAHAIALDRLAEALFNYLMLQAQMPHDVIQTALREDFARGGKPAPAFLASPRRPTGKRRGARDLLPPRQSLHVRP